MNYVASEAGVLAADALNLLDEGLEHVQTTHNALLRGCVLGAGGGLDIEEKVKLGGQLRLLSRVRV